VCTDTLVYSHCNTLQHTATHCNTLQHTYVYSSTATYMTVIYAHMLRIFAFSYVHSVTYMPVIYVTYTTVLYVYSPRTSHIYDCHISLYTTYLCACVQSHMFNFYSSTASHIYDCHISIYTTYPHSHLCIKNEQKKKSISEQCTAGQVCANSCVYRSLHVIATNAYSYVSEVKTQIHIQIEQCNAGLVCENVCVYRFLYVIWGGYDYQAP